MRLLNARTLELHEFFEDKVPDYAILSHTWGEDEVTIDTLRARRFTNQRGFTKIQYTTRQALKDKLEWAWIDTCCIDKSSSAELSEAINSMFNWYRRATSCYAYLEDYKPVQGSLASSLAKCRYFSRGWTLQELIAPRAMYLFDSTWNLIASRRQIARQLSHITGVAEEILQGALFLSDTLSKYSVAQRMSWAANRNTTRIEDRAYSLLGLFNVNMPLIYGEGAVSFKRLQEEIMKTRADLSILGWGLEPLQNISSQEAFDILAASPDDFHSCGGLKLKKRTHEGFTDGEITVTNVALHVTGHVLQVSPRSIGERDGGTPRNRAVMLLQCGTSNDVTTVLAMALMPLEASIATSKQSPDLLSIPDLSMLSTIRCAKHRLVYVDALEAQEQSIRRSLVIARYVNGNEPGKVVALAGKPLSPDKLWVRFSDPNLQAEAAVLEVIPDNLWDRRNRTFQLVYSRPQSDPTQRRPAVEGSIVLWHETTGHVTIGVSYNISTFMGQIRFTLIKGKAGPGEVHDQLKAPKTCIHVTQSTKLELRLKGPAMLYDEEVAILEVRVT